MKSLVAAALIAGGFATALRAETLLEKSFQAFKLPEARMLYRRPLLASGPAESVRGALPAGTEVLLVAVTSSKDWVFVRTDEKIEGWIPTSWVRSAYTINPVEVRERYYTEQLPAEPRFDFSTDVKVWGDDLLLETLKKK